MTVMRTIWINVEGNVTSFIHHVWKRGISIEAMRVFLSGEVENITREDIELIVKQQFDMETILERNPSPDITAYRGKL